MSRGRVLLRDSLVQENPGLFLLNGRKTQHNQSLMVDNLVSSSDKTRPEYPIPTLQARFDLSQKWRGGIGFSSSADREIGFFQHVAPPTRDRKSVV